MNNVYDPERNVPNYVKQWIIAVRRRAQVEDFPTPTSPKSRTKLILEIQARLVDKEMRLFVLQAITGLPLTTQNQLTQGYTSILIDEVLNASNDHAHPIAFIERLLKERTGAKPWCIFPWERPETVLPDMPTLPESNPF